MPKVTVLMPVYNAEKFLAEAIESILQQSLTDFEFLILDDGSIDNSASIIRSYSDGRIKFIQNERNLGITATLNKGIELASAEFIARMDADDISYPSRLYKQHSYLQEHPDCCLVGSQTNTISEDKKQRWKDGLKSEHTYYNLTFFCSIYHPSVMYRKKIVTEAGMYKLPYAEDYELWCRLSRKHQLHVLPETLLDYRLSSCSTSTESKKQEYSQTEFNQILANLKYYAGKEYTLPDSFIECFRFNYKPMLLENKVSHIIACLRELDRITELILAKDNINRDMQAIRDAANTKKKQILKYFLQNLPFRKRVSLAALLTLNPLLLMWRTTGLTSAISRNGGERCGPSSHSGWRITRKYAS